MAKTDTRTFKVFLSISIALITIAAVVFSKSIPNQTELHSAIKSRNIPVKPSATRIDASAPQGYVVVKFKDNDKVRLNSGALYSKTGTSMSRVNSELTSYLPSRLERLFKNFSESDLDLDRSVLSAKSKHELADMNGYYRIDVLSAVEAEQLVNNLNNLSEVELAYFQPNPEPAGFFETAIPDFQGFQDYREAAPDGVDADFANTLPGGNGSGVKIIDIEGSWRHSHADLTSAVGAHIAGTLIQDLSWRNHGTAVLGEMIGDDNGFGVTGICPGADIGTVSIGSMSTEEALLTAADNLQAGDAILIELHAPGPHYDFESRPDQLGYVCMEYWQASFDAIQYCWAKGLVVVEAGGNGAEDFDNATYYGDLFDTTYRNSHAIIAGAGHPPVDFNDLERESFSNYGERVNVQGYGSNVYSTGYGGLYGGGVEDSFYTASFSGTSSASPIITGTVACLQGRYKSVYGVPMTSDQIRSILDATGTPQKGNLSQHIGPRPNLLAAFTAMTAPPSIFTDPIFVDTTINDGTVADIDVWIHNRNTTTAFDYSINDKDSLKNISAQNWLTVSPSAGTVAPLDSVLLDVTLDAALVGDRIEKYSGILEISWGVSGGSLDSISFVPVYMLVPCFDTSYSSISSDDIGGPTYNWVSARTLGSKIPSSLFYNSASNPLDDGTAGPRPIGFSFPFFDSAYTVFYVGVNGAISFTDQNINYGGYFGYMNIPNSDFQTIISAYWNDLIFDVALVPDAGAYIYRSPTSDTCVIEWYKPGDFSVPFDTIINFEIILTKDGNITCQYQEIGNGGLENTATIGVSGSGCEGYSHYTVYNPAPENLVSDFEVVQFNSSLWDYVWGGDCDNSGIVNTIDLNLMINYIFRLGPAPNPFEIGDANCDGTPMQILDLNILINYLFRLGSPPCHYVIFH